MFKNMLSKQPVIYKYWIVFTFLMGISLTFIIPPFQSPDEYNHFYRIYQIADGHIFGELDSTRTQMGGYIPQSLITISRPFEGLYDKSARASLDTIQKYLIIPLEKDKIVFEPFPNTARYAVTAYLPQAITIFLLKLINISPLWMMYLGRLMTFLTWFFIVNIAIQKTPIFKEFFMIFLLLPASLAINSTLNADVITNALFFLLFSLFIKFKIENKVISSKNLLLFSFILSITTLNKACYFPILFILLLIKKEHFRTVNKKLSYIVFNLILNVTVVVLLSKQVHSLVYPIPNNIKVTTYKNLRDGYDVNPDAQTQLIINNPLLFFKNLSIQSAQTINKSGNSWIGGFGWNEVLPSGLLIFFWYLMVLYFLTNKSDFKISERVILVSIAFGMTALFLLSTHLHWDGVGDFIENGWGGKYYIPIFPLYFLSISGLLNNFFNFPKLKTFLNWVIVFSFVIIYVDFLILIFDRFYIDKT
jgi:uncharacterized membrane protein